MTRRRPLPALDETERPAEPGPGFDARRRLCALEQVAALQQELLGRAGHLVAALDRRDEALERRVEVLEARVRDLQGRQPEPRAKQAPSPRGLFGRDSRRYLSIRRAAELSDGRLSPQTIRRLIRRGALRGQALQLSGSQRHRWFVERVSFLALLDAAGGAEAGNQSAPRSPAPRSRA